MTKRAVLFAALQMDPLYEALGEQAADTLVMAATAMLREKVVACGGRTVKTIGDEVFAVFPAVANAVSSAVTMQRGASALASGWPGGSRLRIGFAWGPVVEREGDVFGDTVSLAARASALAGAREIVLSGETAALLPADQRAACRLVHAIDIKGKSVRIEFFALGP